MAEFKDRLRKLRKEKNIYQKELAKKIGVSEGAIGMYETGRRTPDKGILIELASFFDVSIDYLLGYADESKPAEKIKQSLLNDPELIEVWEKIRQRDDLKKFFKQCSSLDPDAIEKMSKISQIFREEESKDK
ncbi:helix-turn-helix domain-containing protein [Fuchsiella alkaliacetigena]|uniref:helix-turn-helix domain-containing protein n=1 Tax=Fuchsiella alkaliacetigena TaxID=957042 RepID=UPI00200B405A|nr:helix-turn-helix transcriptional regulator [Fuchsiella alkaliacetigena]MCK8824105.1 helix-turn-helix domain-containing protein [Fuchsiella alkaliacetigena]